MVQNNSPSRDFVTTTLIAFITFVATAIAPTPLGRPFGNTRKRFIYWIRCGNQCWSQKELTLEEVLRRKTHRQYLEGVSIPYGINTLGPLRKKFNCTSIRYLSLPSTLREILPNEFNCCHKLETIVIPGSEKTTGSEKTIVHSYAFSNLNALSTPLTVYVGKHVEIRKNAFPSETTFVKIP